METAVDAAATARRRLEQSVALAAAAGRASCHVSRSNRFGEGLNGPGDEDLGPVEVTEKV